MPVVALLLVLAAAVLHVGWNALAKSGHDKLSFLFLTLLGGTLVLSAPALALAVHRGGVIDGSVASAWPVLATSAIHAVAFATLAAAYHVGDFSHVYPLARGGAVALVALAAPLILAESLRPLVGVGIAAVVLGAFLLGSAKAQRKAALYAAATALLIASYSLVDKVGVSRIHPVIYIALLGQGTVLFLVPTMWRRRSKLVAEWRKNKRRIAVASQLNLSAYLLVLFAFATTEASANAATASVVVAAREVSIPVSVIAGVAFLGERLVRRRLAAALIILAGVAAISLG